MCGGGGSIPPPPDPREEAAAQILVEQERARLAEETRLRELEREAVEQERLRGEFLGNLDTSSQGAFLRGQGIIEDRGLNFGDFETQLQREIDSIRQSVPFLDPNPGVFFGGNIADTVLDRAQGNQRRGFESSLNEFAGQGFAQNLFPDTADDAILEAILAEQFGPASDQLLRAFQRGNLNQVGFDTATDQLGSQNTAAQSRLQDLGGGVLTTNRNTLKDIAGQGFAGASAFELGGSFDPGNFQTRIDDTFGDLSGRLGGDIRNALGGEQLFDFESLLARGGISQGATNPGAAAPGIADVLADREKDTKKTRGLGSEGVF